MRRIGSVTALYAVFAALVIAAPLSASEEPEPPPVPAPVEEASTTPEPPAPVAAPAEPVEAPPVEAPPPAAAPPAEPVAPPPEPDPAAVPVAAAAGVAANAKAKGKAKARRKVKARAAASATVTISDFQFAPATVTVDVGDTVTWINEGPTPHSATATAGSFDTGIYAEGGRRSETFDQAGTFAYVCTPHPQMKGTVIVEAAAAGAQEDDSGTDSSRSDAGTAQGSAGDDDPSLPTTGLDLSALLVLGLATLALGAYLRRSTG